MLILNRWKNAKEQFVAEHNRVLEAVIDACNSIKNRTGQIPEGRIIIIENDVPKEQDNFGWKNNELGIVWKRCIENCRVNSFRASHQFTVCLDVTKHWEQSLKRIEREAEAMKKLTNEALEILVMLQFANSLNDD